MKYLYLPASPALLPLRPFPPLKLPFTTENEACILREVTDGLLRREIWIQAKLKITFTHLLKYPLGCLQYSWSSKSCTFGRHILHVEWSESTFRCLNELNLKGKRLIQIACLLHTKKEFVDQFRKIQWQDNAVSYWEIVN
jgi:hypothetical protein